MLTETDRLRGHRRAGRIDIFSLGSISLLLATKFVNTALAATIAATVSAPEATVVWSGGSGLWSNRAGWGAPLPVDPVLVNVHIDGGNRDISAVQLDVDATIAGLTIDQSDSLIVQSGRSLTFGTGASTRSILNSGSLRLDGQSGIASLIVGHGGVLALEGQGSVRMYSGDNCRIIGSSAGGKLVNHGNTIRGAGTMGAHTLGIINYGLIDANAAFQTLVIEPDSSGAINAGIMQATNGGRLKLNNGVFNNTGGLVWALDQSRVDLEGATIIGGTLETTGNGLFRTSLAPCTLQNVVINGLYELGPTELTLNGTITNDGSIFVIGADSLAGSEYSDILVPLDGDDVKIQGAGSLDMHKCKIHSGTAVGGARFIHGNEHTITGEGYIGLNTVTLLNRGTIIADRASPIVIDPPNTQPVINEGTLLATGAAGLTLTGGTFQNNGTIEARDGSKCFFTSTSTLANAVGGALTGGTWRVSGIEATGLILIPVPSIFFNEATVHLSGPFSVFAIVNTMLVNYGSFTIDQGRNFTTSGSFFTNAGTLEVGMNSRFTVNTQFSQEAGARLRIEVGEPNMIDGNVGLLVNGTASLGGVLELTAHRDFHPHPGAELHVLHARSIIGSFSSVIAPPGFNVTHGVGEINITIEPPCPGDINHDGQVNVSDLVILINQWGLCSNHPTACQADLDHSGQVDTGDLVILINGWGVCP